MFWVAQPLAVRVAMYWEAGGAPAPPAKGEAEEEGGPPPRGGGRRGRAGGDRSGRGDAAAVFVGGADHLPAAAVGQQGTAREGGGGEEGVGSGGGLGQLAFGVGENEPVAVGGVGGQGRDRREVGRDPARFGADHVDVDPFGGAEAFGFIAGLGRVLEVAAGQGAVGIDFGRKGG